MRITVDLGLTAIANGMLLDRVEDQGKGTVTFQYALGKPHPMYLYSLVVGKFESARDPYRKVPLLYFFEPGKKAEALRGLRKTARAMEFMVQETGVHYQFDQYSQVVGFQFLGGMENTSVTTQTDRILLDERAALDMDFDSLIVHELAHQWFGDLVTCKDWTNGWLNESFATYYETLFFLGDQGEDEFLRRCWMMARSYFEEAEGHYQRPIVTRVWRESFQLFDRHLYTKGGCVLHFLRSLLGPAAWRRAVWYYLEEHRFNSVETKDLLTAIYKSTGKNLENVFEQWIFRPGHPVFRIAVSYLPTRKKVRLWIAQKQALKEAKNLYQIPVQFAFDGKKGRKICQVDLTKAEHVFEFSLDAEPENVVFDPELRILLKSVEWVKPLAMWQRQLQDPNLLIRLEAAEHVASLKSPLAVTILQEFYHRERFWWSRARAAELLGQTKHPEAMAFLRGQLKEKDPKVRRQIVQVLGQARVSAWGPDFEHLFRNDPSLFVAGAALKALALSGHPSARAAIHDGLKTSSWQDWLSCCAAEALGELESGRKELLKLLDKTHSPWVKMVAVRTLSRLDPNCPDLTRIFETLLDDPSEYVSMTALDALEKTGNPALVSGLRKRLEKTRDSIRRSTLDAAIRSLRLGKTDDLPKGEPVSRLPEDASGGS